MASKSLFRGYMQKIRRIHRLAPPGRGSLRGWFPFEHKSEPLLPWPLFIRRLVLSLSLGAGIVMASLLMGMVGYHSFERLAWLDAFLNASMILSGMGPVLEPQSVDGKVFAGIYALYSGFAVLVIAGIAFAPVIHRLLHKFHIDERDLLDTSEPPEHGSNT